MMAASTATVLTAMADRAAANLCRQERIHTLEQEDVRQELLVDVLCRLSFHDPDRAPWRPFVLMCLRHRASHLSRSGRSEHLARHPAALDAVLPDGDGLTLLDTIADDQGFSAWVGQPTDHVAQAERRLDLDRALSAMTASVVPLCAALLAQARTRTGPSRTTLHRRVRDLRCQLLAAGIGAHRGTSRRAAE